MQLDVSDIEEEISLRVFMCQGDEVRKRGRQARDAALKQSQHLLANDEGGCCQVGKESV